MIASFRLVFCSALALISFSASAAPDPEQMERGGKIFGTTCVLCHQPSGQGAPPVYPPLAQSDWMLADRNRAIRVLCEGISGPVTVKGTNYVNAMPAQMLEDQGVADVLTFVGNSWGNEWPAFTSEEVRNARAGSKFKTYAELVKASAYQPLPKAPDGWKLREVVQLPEFCTRLAGWDGNFYVLASSGTVYHLDLASSTLVPIFQGADYIDASRGGYVAMGFTLDPQKRLWLVTNQMLKQEPYYLNEVVIWRSEQTVDGHPAKMTQWFKTTYPHGEGSFNHGVSHLSFGPDGLLYISSGSRTDGGELPKKAQFFPGHEVEITACIWRLDPNAKEPKIEVLARGIRNAYGFDWDGAGHLFTISNGPDFSAPEELDFIEPGKHYGFPYQFSDWPAKAGYPYAHTPAPPAGVEFTFPVVNLGPDGGGTAQQPLSTFAPHSSPAGMLWCGDDYPEPLRNSFLITRFGNLLGAPAAPEDVGFDVLATRLERHPGGGWMGRTRTILEPLGRPLDAIAVGAGRTLILEYTRPTNFKDKLGWLPGRILELAPNR